MSAIQNPTKQEIGKNTKPPLVYENLTALQKAMIDYKVINGLVTLDEPDENGRSFRKITVQQLADDYGVSRAGMYDAKKSLGDEFWLLVQNRRQEIAPQARLAAVHEAWYLKAVKGEWLHLNAYLHNFDPNYKVPQHKVELSADDNLSALMEKARQRELESKNKQPIIEAEVVSKDA